MQFKTYELCISGVSHFIFSVNNWGSTETTESDTWDQRGNLVLWLPLGGKNTGRGHLKPKVIVKWPISSCERKHKHHHNRSKRPQGPNPEMRTMTMQRSSLLECSTSMRMLKPSLSEWFHVQSQSFLTFWTEWPGMHLQEERRATWVQIPPARCNLQISGPQHQSQWPYHQLLSLNGEEETVLLFSSLCLNLIIKRALWKLCFTSQNCSLLGLIVYLELVSH